MRRQPSIRLRLTIWYSTVMLLFFCLISGLIYVFVRQQLDDLFQSKLETGYDTVATVVVISYGDIYDVMHLGHNSLFRLTRDGETVYQTNKWKEADLSAVVGTADTFEQMSWRDPADRHYRIKSGFIPEYNFRLVFAQDITDMEHILDALLLILLAGFPAAALLAVAGGWFMAGRALAPINDMTRQARTISAENLSERLPVPNPRDEIGRLAVVFNDTLSRLQHSFEQLRRFTADASHELRTPLTSLRATGEVALSGKVEPARLREAIASMLEETERLTHLVDNLLILARGDSGKFALPSVRLDLGGMVAAVIDDLKVLAEEKSQHIEFRGDGPLTVRVHAATVRQAILNVVHNAIRYTPNGGHIEVVLSGSGDGWALLDVRDDGPGIPTLEQEKVFERFYRLDKARSRAEGGTGLGLSIARWGIRTNGGEIGFVPDRTPGTCCRIRLPLAAEE